MLDETRNLKRLSYFAAVVEAASFTAAAERLGVTKGVVSQQVARLEADFETSLLVRTTRKVLPTPAGHALYARCLKILREAQEAFEELTEGAVAPSGSLRLTAPLDYGMAVVVPAAASFVDAHPACRVEVLLKDQLLDLAEHNLEMAVRVGWLANASVQARRIGTFEQVAVAAASLIERQGAPEQPADLARWPFIANLALSAPLAWTFKRGDDLRQVTLSSSISLDATMAVQSAVALGAGFSVLPDYAVADDVAAGRLVRLLPDWGLPPGGIHIVYPASRFRSARTRAFANALLQAERSRSA